MTTVESAAASTPAQDAAMTEDEIALYDRQIRLWGMGAQEKLRAAHVLLLTIRGLGNEIAKNLVLAGIGALTICDAATISEADLGAQFLLAGEENNLNKKRAAVAAQQLRAMNPRVRIHVLDDNKVDLSSPQFYAQFTLVVATDLTSPELTRVNAATREAQRPLYAAGTYGLYGYAFADLIAHDFVIVRARGNVPTTVGAQETPTRVVLDVQSGGDKKDSKDSKDKNDKNDKKDQNDDQEAITKRERYVPWSVVASEAGRLPAVYVSSARRLRKVTPVLPCLRALWAFQTAHVNEEDNKDDDNHHTPRENDPADLAQFIDLVGRHQKALGVPDVASTVIRQFLQGVADREISPVVTVLGGNVAQDMINALGHTQQPIQNLAVFDGANMTATMYALHPEKEESVESTGEAVAAISVPKVSLDAPVVN